MQEFIEQIVKEIVSGAGELRRTGPCPATHIPDLAGGPYQSGTLRRR